MEIRKSQSLALLTYPLSPRSWTKHWSVEAAPQDVWGLKGAAPQGAHVPESGTPRYEVVNEVLQNHSTIQVFEGTEKELLVVRRGPWWSQVIHSEQFLDHGMDAAYQ